MSRLSCAILAALILCALTAGPAACAEPVTLRVDVTRAAAGIAYVHEVVPTAPGELTLVYPKWIPGEHGPTGPLADLAALRISAGGHALDWNRDPVDMYAFHVNVPSDVFAVDVDFDVLMNAAGDTMSTHSVAILNWNRYLLYKSGINSHDYYVKPALLIPVGWEFATALRDPARSDNRIDFAVTTLATLVDSPLDIGRYAKKWDLWKDGSSFVQLDAFADFPEDLNISSELLKAYERVPAEAFALYGSRHFDDYHALLALSNDVGFVGIEHHQSSDNRMPDKFLTEEDQSLASGDLVLHEFSHSWNGKYRRPADLTTPNFQVPQLTDLLWVYEGMNQYLGDVLSFRSGIRKPSEYPEYLAHLYAELDYETGRSTTPIIDLTTGAPHFYLARGSYGGIRRSSDDFYDEGELIWLDADTIIRQRSSERRSLDTFLHRYTEPSTTGPITVTYTRAQIESLLDGVLSYDWHAFFDTYVYHIAPHPPSDEIERSGWKIVYTARPNVFEAANDRTGHEVSHWYDLGVTMDDKDESSGGGGITNVRDGSPAWKAGLALGMEVVAVNNRAYSKEVLNRALASAEYSTSPITLIVKQTDWFQTISIDYHGGLRYPHLERIEGKPDMLAEIMSPHAK